MKKVYKPKKCKVGKELFVPINPFQPTCFEHAGEWMKIQSAKKLEKKQKAQRKVMKENVKTYSDWVKELQVIFNTFIRLRDKDKQCICCEKWLYGKYDAGHYFPTGSYPMLRFDEFNTHGQTVHCNRDKHGNLAEYTIHLPTRIGTKEFEALKVRRLTPRKYSIPELIELKTHYRKKITKRRKGRNYS